MARKSNPNDAYEREQGRIMRERMEYLKKHPEEVSKPKGPMIGKHTPKKTTTKK